MTVKANIEKVEEYLKQVGLENGDLEELLEPIKQLNNQRRYGLVWEEPDTKTYGADSAEQELIKNFPFLKEVTEHRIYNGEGKPDHLLIEGDNLHALKTMQYTHKNKIDVIYIDPPYNTGNTDFVYNDKYVDNEDSWRHSKWLSFMDKRLRLARNLMSDDGVIFISIDEYEFAQLKLLCDQVFGESNFIENFIWIKNATKNNSKTTSTNHEYVLSYAKRISEVMKESTYFRIKKNGFDEVLLYVEKLKSEGLSYKEAEECLRDFYRKNKNYKGISSYNNIDENYQVFASDNTSAPSGTGDKYEVIHPKTNKPCKNPAGGYRYKHETMLKHIKNDRILFGDTEDTVPRYKRFLTDVKSEVMKSIIENNTDGRKELINLFDGISPFNNPKPVTLIESFLISHPKPNATVLDFFAGSGTTAHAVMELNKEDGGNRQAIVITNNEINETEEEDLLVEKGFVEPFTGSRRGTKKHAKWIEQVNEFKQTPEYLEFIQTDEYKDLGIARAVTEQRISKVIKGYTTPKGKEVEGLGNNNFYHFEVVLESDLEDIDLNTYVLVKKTKDIIRIKEGVYTGEHDISTGTVPSVKLVNDEKEVIVVLSVRVTDTDIEELVGNFEDSEKEHVIYTSYTGYDYGINGIRFEELPKELLQVIKYNEGK